MLVGDETPAVCHGTANRDVVIHHAFLQAEYGDKVCPFRRAIAVEQLYITADQTAHLLTSQRHVAYRKGIALKQQCA